MFLSFFHVPRILHNGWAREGFDIRKDIGVGDANRWEAWVDNNDGPGTAIIVRGRSRSSVYDHANSSYHRKDPTSEIAVVHQQTVKAIEKDTNRQSIYFKIIFSELLDNVILSGDSVQIQKGRIGTSHMVGNIDCKSQFVNWTLAIKDKGHKMTYDQQNDLEDDFA